MDNDGQTIMVLSIKIEADFNFDFDPLRDGLTFARKIYAFSAQVYCVFDIHIYTHMSIYISGFRVTNSDRTRAELYVKVPEIMRKT